MISEMSGLTVAEVNLSHAPYTMIAGAIGALRGYKVTLGPMLVMIVAFWLIGVPLGVRLGYHGLFGADAAPMAVYGFWTGLVTALILAAIALTAWLRVVARERIAA